MNENDKSNKMSKNEICAKISLDFFNDVNECYNKNKIHLSTTIDKNNKKLIWKCILDLDEKYNDFKSSCLI